jgi:flagellar biosynthesis/type III secretory pathway chaperone
MLSASNIPLAETLVGQLHGLLESEFDLLKSGQVDNLDELQNRKAVLLEQLAQVAPGQGLAGQEVPTDWKPFAEKARACRMLHQRNETLVSRKLDAVRGALNALQVSAEGLIDETYDRKGRLSWGGARRRTPQNAYQDV